MNLIQRTIIALLPQRWAAVIEAESRAWRMRCDCVQESSVWEMGGMRYKARGNPRRLARCIHCGKTALRDFYHVETSA
jgi:hypothetical protein